MQDFFHQQLSTAPTHHFYSHQCMWDRCHRLCFLCFQRNSSSEVEVFSHLVAPQGERGLLRILSLVLATCGSTLQADGMPQTLCVTWSSRIFFNKSTSTGFPQNPGKSCDFVFLVPNFILAGEREPYLPRNLPNQSWEKWNLSVMFFDTLSYL